MSDDNIIDIKSRLVVKADPNTWHMIGQLIATSGVLEVVRVMADIVAEKPEDFPELSAIPGYSEEVAAILREAAKRIEMLEDTITPPGQGQ